MLGNRLKTILESALGKPVWRTLSENIFGRSLGQFVWGIMLELSCKTLLGNSVAQPYWNTLLENLLGKLSWRTLL